MRQQGQGEVLISVQTAVQLDRDELRAIVDRFLARIEVEGAALGDYRLEAEVDPRLISGFIIVVDGVRYDFSVRGRLDQMARTMKAEQAASTSLEDIHESVRAQLEKLPDIHAQGAHAARQGEPSEARVERGAIVDEVGEVLAVADGIAYVNGLRNCVSDELLEFSDQASGIAMNLEHDRVGVVLLGRHEDVAVGQFCRRTGRTVSVPVGDALLGRVVDALGQPIDGDGPLGSRDWRPVEFPAASVADRQPVTEPLYSGITAVDALTPIGRGQRELIIGDRQTGKTSIAIDTILNQRDQNVICVYVAIGQKMSTLASVVHTLASRGAMAYTVVVAAGAADPASMQYLAPFAGAAIAEYWMYEQHRDVLVVYDDLTKHAQAYRNISLLLRRPPGREAYPGDIFYLHSRLLERAGRLSDEIGGGSITALPIVETQSGDISAYIPTNVISITDGQIYLETELFFAGQRPAINVGLSVSRVGGDAQAAAMKRIAGSLRMNLAQYNEIASFAQFGSDLDDETQAQLRKGQSLNEVLKQEQYLPRSMAESVVMLYLATSGILADLEIEEMHPFIESFHKYLLALHPDFLPGIAAKGSFDDADRALIERACQLYIPQWHQEQEIDETEL